MCIVAISCCALHVLYVQQECRFLEQCGGGRVGLRRRFKAPISSEARVRIPSFAPYFSSAQLVFLFLHSVLGCVVAGPSSP